MTVPLRRAAQYIRMSTDRQDLSPDIQTEAISAFARANGFEVICTYEDDGKSGVELSKRPRMRQLLDDVAGAPSFTDILVFDVSRWGRFQDVDAAAYHEYHCRMHGVQVIFVNETFANDLKPTTVLLKSMRRVMAAEYSRDIAQKSRAGQERVVSMGFQMGALPPLGYRRCSVSADGSRRVMLEHGQRKPALTDRIEWVLGPEPEVALVRKICAAYAAGLPLEDVAGLAKAEGWRTAKGRPVSTGSLRNLLEHEALIGNFVWGAKSKGGKILKCAPTRMDGCVARIIDDATWGAIQARIKASCMRARDRKGGEADRAASSRSQPRRQLALKFDQGLTQTYRRTLGLPQQLRDHTREFGRALCSALCRQEMPASFDTRSNILSFWGARVRIRLMWPTDAHTWSLGRNRSTEEVDHVLVARMTALFHPQDFLFLPAEKAKTAFSLPLRGALPRDLEQYWCRSREDLVRRLAKVSAATVRRRRGKALP